MRKETFTASEFVYGGNRQTNAMREYKSGDKVMGDSVFVASSACGRFGFPPNVAMICNGRVITWDDVRKEKRERQAEHLAVKLSDWKTEHTIPVYVWTFYNDSPFYGGWWCYIQGIRREHTWAVNFQNLDENKMFEMVREIFPCGYLPGLTENYEWMAAFAKTYPCKGKRKQEGKAFCWATICAGRIEKLFLKKKAEVPA